MTSPTSRQRSGFLATHPRLAWGLCGLLSAAAAGYAGYRVATAESRAMVHVVQGDEAREREDWARAALHYTEALEVADDLAYPYHARAVCLASLDRGDEARADLDVAASLGADSAAYHHDSGLVHERLEDLPAALRSIDAALALAPADEYLVMRHRIQARVALGNADPETAMRAYAAWIELDPSDPTPHTNMGWAKALRHDYDGALECLTRAIVLDPDDATHYFNRSESYRKLGRHDEALRDFEQAVRLQPTLRNIERLAESYEEIADWTNAARAYSALLDSSPTDTRARGRRGLARAFAGQGAKALEDFDELIGEDDDHPLYWFWRGLARLAAGDRVGAREDQEHSAELDMLGTLKQREELETEITRLADDLADLDDVQKYLIGNY